MAPRTILYTGKGGVGKTSVAAATARRVAASGVDTVILSTDPAHSLADSLETPVGGEPTQVGERLWAQQVAAQDEMERNWAAVQDWLGELLLERGVDRISAEELTVPPGLDELFSLLQIKRHHEDGRFGCVIVDCAPTGETLRLLSFPDVARWWLQKVFPQSPQLMAAVRPLARAMLDVSLPGDAVLDDVQRLVRNLIAMNEILRDTEQRLGAPGDDARPDGGRRGAADLHLPEPLRLSDRRRDRQPRLPRGGRVVLRRVARAPARSARARSSPPSRRCRCCARRTSARRSSAARCSTASAPTSSRTATPARSCTSASRRSYVVGADAAELRLDLPFAEKGDISLKKIGLELVVRVDGHKRTLMLPPALGDYRPTGASFDDGALRVTFDGPA